MLQLKRETPIEHTNSGFNTSTSNGIEKFQESKAKKSKQTRPKSNTHTHTPKSHKRIKIL